MFCFSSYLKQVLQSQKFLGLRDPDPLVRGSVVDPDPDPGSGSVLDPYSIGPLDPDPDP